MTTCAFDQLMATLNGTGNRRTVLQALGASTLAAGTGLAISREAQGKHGKHKKKRKQKQGASPAPQDFVACHDVVVTRCLVGDTVCIAAGDQCCTQLAAGRTADAVRCLVTGPVSRVP